MEQNPPKSCLSVDAITDPGNQSRIKGSIGVRAVLTATAWIFWNQRNGIVLYGNSRSSKDLANEVIRAMYSWTKITGSKGHTIDWWVWCYDPNFVCLNIL